MRVYKFEAIIQKLCAIIFSCFSRIATLNKNILFDFMLWRPATLFKKGPDRGAFLWILRNFYKNTYIGKHLRFAASKLWMHTDSFIWKYLTEYYFLRSTHQIWTTEIYFIFVTQFTVIISVRNVPCIPESRIEIKIKLNFYFHTSLWCLKRFYEGNYSLHKTFFMHHTEVWK